MVSSVIERKAVTLQNHEGCDLGLLALGVLLRQLGEKCMTKLLIFLYAYRYRRENLKYELNVFWM